MSGATEPTHGWTRLGHAVHAKVADHHPTGSAYQRFNQKVALWLTNNVGTMTCFWIVLALCLSVLPSVLFAMAVVPRQWGVLPSFLTGFGFELMMTWIVSTCFQALCLPAIIVGQNLQNEAADARAAKTFEDVEAILHGQEQIAQHLATHDAVLTRIDPGAASAGGA